MGSNKTNSKWSSSILQSIPIIYLVCILLSATVPLIIATIEKSQTGAWPEWSGLGDYESNPISIPKDPSGNEEFVVQFERSKTLWDWLELLLIPAVISGGAIWLQRWAKQSSEENAQHERKLTREIEAIRSRESALQTYFDRMTDLLLDRNLRTKSNKDARAITRARTLSLLQKLKMDGIRKGSLILFLYETVLISGIKPVLSLHGADLNDVDLRGATLPDINFASVSIERGQFQGAHLENSTWTNAYLENTNFSGAFLNQANLEGAYLLGADFSGTDLQKSILKDTILSESEVELKSAYSLKGATMMDGTLHKAPNQLDENT